MHYKCGGQRGGRSSFVKRALRGAAVLALLAGVAASAKHFARDPGCSDGVPWFEWLAPAPEARACTLCPCECGCGDGTACPTKSCECGGDGCVGHCAKTCSLTSSPYKPCGGTYNCATQSPGCAVGSQRCDCGGTICKAGTRPCATSGPPYVCKTSAAHGCNPGTNGACNCGTYCSLKAKPCTGSTPCHCRTDQSGCARCGDKICNSLSNPGACTRCGQGCKCEWESCVESIPNSKDWDKDCEYDVKGGPCGCVNYGGFLCDGTHDSFSAQCCSGCGGTGKEGVGCSSGECVEHCGSAPCPCGDPSGAGCLAAPGAGCRFDDNPRGACFDAETRTSNTCLRCPKPGNSATCKNDGENGGYSGFVPCFTNTYP